MEKQSWLADGQRLAAEFNAVAVMAFLQEFGAAEATSVIEMTVDTVQEDLHLNVGGRAAFLADSATGLVFKIGTAGRVNYEKCVGHISGVTGQELYRWLWW